MGHRRMYRRGHKVHHTTRKTDNRDKAWKNIAIPIALLLIFLLIVIFSGAIPYQAIAKTDSKANPASNTVSSSNNVDGEGKDIISKARSISMKVPTKGNSLLGTTESMQDMYFWQLDSSYQLIQGFTETMSLFGLQDQDYVVDMQTALNQGINLANKNWVNR